MSLNAPKVIAWLAVALVLLYLLRSPEHAGALLHDGAAALVAVGRSLAAFLRSLF